jgi:hypothetical protein
MHLQTGPRYGGGFFVLQEKIRPDDLDSSGKGHHAESVVRGQDVTT